MAHINDIEQLKRQWRQVSIRPPHIEKARSLKDKLIARLKRPFFAIAGCLTGLIPMVRDFHIPIWFIVFYCLFCALAGCFTFIQIRMLKKVDFASISTVEAIGFIQRFTFIRQRMKIILITLAVPLIGTLMWFFNSHREPAMLAGALTGALVGGIIGWNMNYRFKRDMKSIEEVLGDISDKDDPSTSYPE